MLGGRLYHVATDYYRYFGEGKNPLNALKIWDGGLGIWGAIALSAVGAWIGCRRRGVPLPVFADAVRPDWFAVYVAGYTLGRCWIELMRADDATHVFGVRIKRLDVDSRVPRRVGLLRPCSSWRGWGEP